jgi:hypothetical protein
LTSDFGLYFNFILHLDARGDRVAKQSTLFQSTITRALITLSFPSFYSLVGVFIKLYAKMGVIDQPQSKGQESNPGDFAAVQKSIIELLDQPDYDDGSAGPVLVRLAW